MSETKAEKKRAKFAREFGSVERVEWVHEEPCVVCGYAGPKPRDNHHTKGDGTSRKGPYESIVPLCKSRWNANLGMVVPGCHTLVHSEGVDTFRERRGITKEWAELAAETQSRWLEYLEG